MEIVNEPTALRRCIGDWRKSGLRIGFVPTMGNLHAGHYSLIDLAKRNADRVVASVFVNPTQFGPGEDFNRYPRTLEEDSAGLNQCGCDLLFAPQVEAIYPYGMKESLRIEVPLLGEALEGAVRPGHFSGVATVVAKLFNLVTPDIAVFGRKDFQQLLVVERLVTDLALPIEILAAPTLREPTGLAMSSRNQYLSGEERERAGCIYQTLCAMRQQLRDGVDLRSIETNALTHLERHGFAADYAVVRRMRDLQDPQPNQSSGLIALIAARLGKTRLIDNLADLGR